MRHIDSDEIQLTIEEYASLIGLSRATVYRHIKKAKLIADRIDGVTHVILDEMEYNELNQNRASQGESAETQRLDSENLWLRERVESLEKQLADASQQNNEASQRSDTIILKMTQQLEQMNLMLEDLRGRKKPWWERWRKA